jgi:phosphatidate phosphatase APP1
MWDVQVHAWLYDEKTDTRQKNFLDYMPLADKHLFESIIQRTSSSSSSSSSSSQDLYERRIRPFLVNNIKKKSIYIKIGDIGGKLPGKSTNIGHVHSSLLLKEVEIEDSVADDGFTLKLTSTTKGEESKTFEGYSFLSPANGYTVISSIRDTIHVSNSLDRQCLLSSFFCEEYQAVPGMNVLFQKYKQEMNASIHFIDLAPWQLYEEIANFVEKQGFPKATYDLMKTKFEDGFVLKQPLFTDKLSKETRRMKIEKMIQQFPFRKYALIGNTAGDDPELYGEIFRAYPRRIHRILIRDCTTGADPNLIEAASRREQLNLNKKKRIEDAMYRVPSERWQIFFEPTKIVL